MSLARHDYDTLWYRRQRAYERKRVDAGGVRCWRCGKPILPGHPFDLGHDDVDRTIIRGPEHPRCNRATARHARERRAARKW